MRLHCPALRPPLTLKSHSTVSSLPVPERYWICVEDEGNSGDASTACTASDSAQQAAIRVRQTALTLTSRPVVCLLWTIGRYFAYGDIEYGRLFRSVAQDLFGVACMVKRNSPPSMISWWRMNERVRGCPLSRTVPT